MSNLLRGLVGLLCCLLLASGCGKSGDVTETQRETIPVELPPWSEVDLRVYKGPVALEEIRFHVGQGIAASPQLHRAFLQQLEIGLMRDGEKEPAVFQSVGTFTGNPKYRFSQPHDEYGSDSTSVWRHASITADRLLAIRLRNLCEETLNFKVALTRGAFSEEAVAWQPEPLPPRSDDGLRFHLDNNPDMLMADLARFEAQGDYAGAQWYLDDIFHHFEPAPVLESILELRSMMYEARRFGFSSVEALLHDFLTGAEDFEAQGQALTLQDFYTYPDTSLLVWWSNRPVDEAKLNGKVIEPAENGFGVYAFYDVLPLKDYTVEFLFSRGQEAPEVQFLWLRNEHIFAFDRAQVVLGNATTESPAVRVDAPFDVETPAHAFLDLHAAPRLQGQGYTVEPQVMRFQIGFFQDR